MAQHDYNIANDTGANVRADINNALGAIQSMNSGTSAPSSAVAGQLHFDTATERVYQYDGTTWNVVWFHDASENKISFFGNLRDENGVIVFNASTTTSAVNNLAVANAATGSSPTLSSEGDDTNIDITLSPKGDGVVDVGGNGTLAKVVSYVPTQDGIYMVAATTSYSGAATNIGTHGFQHHYKIDGSGESRITVDGSISAASTELWSLNQNGDMTLNVGQYLGVTTGGITYSFDGDEDSGMTRIGSNQVAIAAGGTSDGLQISTTAVAPLRPLTMLLGSSSFRWAAVYAVNGTIQTSDLNFKTDVEKLNDAERRVAVAAKRLLRRYRMKASFEEKGSGARYHFGIIAQELEAAFKDEGLDPFAYGMLCRDEVNGEMQYSVRYDELFAFLIAAM